MTRGEIWWVDFGLAYGSMPQGRRPAIIVQNDNFNASHILTTVVVPLTTNTNLAEYKDNIFLEKNGTLLSKDSVALEIIIATASIASILPPIYSSF